jgi:hypothetical protein
MTKKMKYKPDGPSPRDELPGQQLLFDEEQLQKDWELEWGGMPAFKPKDRGIFQEINILFDSWEDVEQFGRLIGQQVRRTTRALWYPDRLNSDLRDKMYHDTVPDPDIDAEET